MTVRELVVPMTVILVIVWVLTYLVREWMDYMAFPFSDNLLFFTICLPLSIAIIITILLFSSWRSVCFLDDRRYPPTKSFLASLQTILIVVAWTASTLYHAGPIRWLAVVVFLAMVMHAVHKLTKAKLWICVLIVIVFFLGFTVIMNLGPSSIAIALTWINFLGSGGMFVLIAFILAFILTLILA